MLKRFVNNIISAALEVIMWITLIGCAITGAVLALDGGTVFAIVGFAVGAIAGLLVNVSVWGIISVIIEIRDYVKQIAEK